MSKTHQSNTTLIGMLIGAVICAIGRPLVLLFHLGEMGEAVILVVVPSAVIGLMVGGVIGAIAGIQASPVTGAAIGGVVSGIAFGGFMYLGAQLAGLFGSIFGNQAAAAEFLIQTWTYLAGMMLVGVVAGAICGLVAQRRIGVNPGRKRSPESPV